MRTTLFLLVIFQCFFVNAQNRRGMQNSSQGRQQGASQQSMPDFEPVKAAGITIYDAKQVQKKLKLKKDPVAPIVQTAIENHNTKMNALKLINTGIFDKLKVIVNSKRKEAMATRDFSKMSAVQQYINTTLEPIRKTAKESEILLNENLKKELSEEQFKKWIKYKKQLKSKNNPKTQMNSKGGQTANKSQKRRH